MRTAICSSLPSTETSTMRSLACFMIAPFACLAALTAACSSAAPTAGAAPPAATSEPTAPAPCDDGTYRTLAGDCERYPSVSVTPSPVSIAPARDHHTTIILETSAGPYLYVFGGTADWKQMYDDVQRAPIAPDGSLGAFESAGRLPTPRAGHCIAKVKDKLLLAGGVVQSGGRMETTASSLVVTLDASGKVAEVAPGPELPQTALHLTCDVAGDWVYALGGRSANGRSTTMSARARIGDGGTVGAFEAQPALRPDRSHHASLVRGSRLYVIGGLTGNPTGKYEEHADVIAAEIGEDGALSDWAPAGALPAALSVSAALLYKDAVYLFGGLSGADFSDEILRATFADDGALGTFSKVKGRLGSARGHVHQLPAWKNVVYSVGGKDAYESIGTIDIARFE